MVDALWNRRDIVVAGDLFADDFDNGPARPPGPAFSKQWHLSTAASFPDLRYKIDEIVADARGCVAFHWTATGT